VGSGSRYTTCISCQNTEPTRSWRGLLQPLSLLATDPVPVALPVPDAKLNGCDATSPARPPNRHPAFGPTDLAARGGSRFFTMRLRHEQGKGRFWRSWRGRLTLTRDHGHLPSSTDPPRRCSPVPCAHWSTGTVRRAAQTQHKHGLRRSVAGSTCDDGESDVVQVRTTPRRRV